MKQVTPDAAVAMIGGGRTMVASPGCGAPVTLLEAIGRQAPVLEGSRLYSGMLLGDYPFLTAVEEGLISYGTWHVMSPVRDLVANGTVDFFPIRGSKVPALMGQLGVDTALIRVTPPDRHGYCSLGPSVSYPLLAVRMAGLVVAEIDEAMPRTLGESSIHMSEIDVAVAADRPAAEYRRAASDEISMQIAKHILNLLPPSPTLQIGIGAIPETLVDELLAEEIGDLRFAGMGVDGFADLFDAGLLARDRLYPYPPVMTAELMGSRRLMDFADLNPAVGMFSTSVGINGQSLGAIDRFVSINSAVEIDLRGQVNSEWVGGRQFSGVGGSLDFIDAAMNSAGGMRIVAFPSANVRRGVSKLVRELEPSTPISLQRQNVDYVVTEYGVAHLALASERERREALTEIAHPDHRSELLEVADG
jgi:4-hydroxybutyrate CoA-transferase